MIDKLPPAPWKDELGSIVDAEGHEVLGMCHKDGGDLVASPEVLRAILALPLLVAAAREVVAKMNPLPAGGLTRGAWNDLVALRDALAAIDERSGIVETPT